MRSIWFLINDLVKVEVYRLLHLGTARHQRHLARVNASLHPAGVARWRLQPLTRQPGLAHVRRWKGLAQWSREGKTRGQSERKPAPAGL